MRRTAVLLVALGALAITLSVGCAPPPIYAPTPHPVVLLDEPGIAANAHLPSTGVLTGSVVVRGPIGVYAYAGGESEAAPDSSAGREHQGWYVGLGASHAFPLSDAVRGWVELSGGLASGTSQTQGFDGLVRDPIFVEESGDYTAPFGTLSLVAEHQDTGGFRSMLGLTTRAARLDYDLTVASRDAALRDGQTVGWVVEPGLVVGLGNDWVQLRWRHVWTLPQEGLAFSVRSSVTTFEGTVRLPLRRLWE
ncbi:MAG: hypothetical protein AAGG50_06835 [Bacteroidota bacterium]